MLKGLTLLPLALALNACADPLKSVDRIEEPRPLAARVEVDGDPGRASPAPGELVHVKWLVAAPDGDVPSGFKLSACQGTSEVRGLLHCGGPVFATSAADALALPSFDFSVPADFDTTASPRLTILGSLCANGNGNPSNGGAACNGGEELPVSLDFSVTTSSDANQNPNFGPDSITLGEATWPTASAPSSGCQGFGLPELSRAAGKVELGIALAESSREALAQTNPEDPTREELRISHFTSAGELEAPFSEILPGDERAAARVAWQPPKSAPSDGLLVRFWFVVRDLRGGSDFTERAICLLP